MNKNKLPIIHYKIESESIQIKIKNYEQEIINEEKLYQNTSTTKKREQIKKRIEKHKQKIKELKLILGGL